MFWITIVINIMYVKLIKTLIKIEFLNAKQPIMLSKLVIFCVPTMSSNMTKTQIANFQVKHQLCLSSLYQHGISINQLLKNNLKHSSTPCMSRASILRDCIWRQKVLVDGNFDRPNAKTLLVYIFCQTYVNIHIKFNYLLFCVACLICSTIQIHTGIYAAVFT